MLRILIADDHAVVRQGLRHILADIPELGTVGEASDGQDALNQVRAQPWDVLVLDMSMPGRGGLDILKDVRRERPETRVLVLSMHPVRKVMSGGKYVSDTLAEKLAFDVEVDSDKPRHEKLSDREFQVLRQLAAGRSVQQIAEELVLSPKTISTYRARVLEKLDLKTNAELIHYAIGNKLVE